MYSVSCLLRVASTRHLCMPTFSCLVIGIEIIEDELCCTALYILYELYVFSEDRSPDL